MAYYEARAGLARAGVTYAGYAAPRFEIRVGGINVTRHFDKRTLTMTSALGQASRLMARVRGTFRAPVAVTAVKSVIAFSDFSYLGSFAIPYVPMLYGGTCDPLFTQSLTHRYVDGVLRLYAVVFKSDQPPGQIAEIYSNATLKTSTPYNRPNWYGSTTICEAHGGYDYTPTAPLNDGIGGSGAPVEDICWDPVDEKMYWVAVRDYDPQTDAPVNVGYLTLSSPTGTDASTQTGGLGAVRMSPTSYGAYGPRYIKDIILLPEWFTAALPTLGCRLGCAGGGGMSTEAQGPTSMGPALIATSPLDSATDTMGTYRDLAPRVPMVFHAWHSNGVGVEPLRAVRDTHYGNLGTTPWPPPGGSWGEGTGWWCAEDFHQGHSVWIETPTKAGWLVFPRFVVGTGLLSVTDDTTPTTTQFALNDTSHVLAGDKFLIDNDVHRPDIQSGSGNAEFQTGHTAGHTGCAYPASPQTAAWGQIRTVSSVSGAVVTCTPALTQAPAVGARYFSGEAYVDAAVGWGRARPAWVCYDPTMLLQAARGELDVDKVPWAWESDPPGGASPEFTATAPYVFPSTEGGHRGTVRGATYDSVTQRLYVLMHGGNVHVYQVSG